MRVLPSRRVSGRAWWGLFALLIAAPALALSWLGLRAVRAERLEAEQQQSSSKRDTLALRCRAVLRARDRPRVEPGALAVALLSRYI